MSFTPKTSLSNSLLLFIVLSFFSFGLSVPNAQADTQMPIINYYETPLQAILTENAFAEHQELSTISLTQTLNRVENPDEVTITLIQSGFLDDSINGTKEIYQLRLTPKGWVIEHKDMLIKCYRGPNTTDYVEQICL